MRPRQNLWLINIDIDIRLESCVRHYRSFHIYFTAGEMGRIRKRGLFKKYENGSSHLPYIEKGKTAKPIFTLLDESRQGYILDTTF